MTEAAREANKGTPEKAQRSMQRWMAGRAPVPA
jgi:hypothetical protein